MYILKKSNPRQDNRERTEFCKAGSDRFANIRDDFFISVAQEFKCHVKIPVVYPAYVFKPEFVTD
jgi:hypothetical protein